jgi:hypothetical protein
MWQLRHPGDGRHAYAVIIPHGTKATAAWFSQGIPQEARNFTTWHDAMTWLNGKFKLLQVHGWREEDTAEG